MYDKTILNIVPNTTQIILNTFLISSTLDKGIKKLYTLEIFSQII